MASPYVVVRREWTSEHLETVREELDTVVAQFADDTRPPKDVLISFARAIEHAHGIEEYDIPF